MFGMCDAAEGVGHGLHELYFGHGLKRSEEKKMGL